jgi:hypothetical protein
VEYIFWIGLGLIIAFISGSINKSKGRSEGEGFALGCFLGIIGLIIVALLPRNDKVIETNKVLDGSSKVCPYCAEIIKKEASVCRFCGRELTQNNNGKKPQTYFAQNIPTSTFELSDSQIELAISFIKNGEKVRAQKILADYIEKNPKSERAWLWITACYPNNKDRIFCLNKVLEINPYNEQARNGLLKMGVY